MKLKYTTPATAIASCALMLAAALPAAAATAVPEPIKLHDVKVAVNPQEKTLALKLDFDMNAISLPRDREIIYTPVIISEQGTDSIELEPIVIAGRNRW